MIGGRRYGGGGCEEGRSDAAIRCTPLQVVAGAGFVFRTSLILLTFRCGEGGQETAAFALKHEVSTFKSWLKRSRRSSRPGC